MIETGADTLRRGIGLCRRRLGEHLPEREAAGGGPQNQPTLPVISSGSPMRPWRTNCVFGQEPAIASPA
jgi:hypothetical protein